MRKIAVLILAAAGVSLAGSASAADIATRPVYTKAAPPAVFWSWTGGYMGLYVGGATGASDYTNTNPFAVTAPTSYKLGSSFIGGYTGGYNWQFAPNWLLGYESETGYMKMKTTGLFPPAGPAFGTNEVGNLYSTISARFGYVMDKSLLYVKGGAALARFDTGVYSGAPGVGFTNHKYVTGYVAGGGWEYYFAPMWSIKAEYEYLGFDKNFTYFGPGGLASTSHFDGIHTGKVGLNYKWHWLQLFTR